MSAYRREKGVVGLLFCGEDVRAVKLVEQCKLRSVV
jgi:hypothetical protein